MDRYGRDWGRAMSLDLEAIEKDWAAGRDIDAEIPGLLAEVKRGYVFDERYGNKSALLRQEIEGKE